MPVKSSITIPLYTYSSEWHSAARNWRPANNVMPRTHFMVYWCLVLYVPLLGNHPTVISLRDFCSQLVKDTLHGRHQGHLAQGKSSGVCLLFHISELKIRCETARRRNKQWCAYFHYSCVYFMVFRKKPNAALHTLRVWVWVKCRCKEGFWWFSPLLILMLIRLSFYVLFSVEWSLLRS